MKATVLPDFGAAVEVRPIPLPHPGEGEVRVRVRAASVNGFDVSVANGQKPPSRSDRALAALYIGALALILLIVLGAFIREAV
jgi:NADPH:quinone reductase-like Zn-dependent oxidoreductase